MYRSAGLPQDGGSVTAHGRARLQSCRHQPRFGPAETLALPCPWSSFFFLGSNVLGISEPYVTFDG
jgi:hypothetical protein